MEEIDYDKIGLISGIEIHQQLDTHKLFCNCPSIIRDDKPHKIVKRWLRASAGETGEIDKAAKAEMQKQKYNLYETYDDTTCLVELDEEPPKDMNQNALSIVLQISKMLNANIVDTIQIMRKTVVDGSNTSGFQRTALVSLDGKINVSDCEVDVTTICIEEDAAKIIETTHDYRKYNLSKLGIPLIELCTGPNMRSPKQVKDVAEYLGMILRSTGKVKRGLGTIRQDVNVSIKGGKRIEIKGAQDLKMIPTWVENEAKRQLALLEIKDILPNDFMIEKDFVDVSDLFSSCESKIVKSTFEKKGVIMAVKLPGFAGLIGKETMPGKRLGTEFSDYAKHAAGVGGIFHSDELPKYGITEEYVSVVRQKLNCKEEDGFVLVAESHMKSLLALTAVVDRANRCKEGVISEVRKPNPDGTSNFMRPMPGAARMYPETDCKPIVPDVSNIKIPKLLTERKNELKKKYSLTDDMTNALFKSQKEDLFVELVAICKNLKSSFIAETLITSESEIFNKFKIEAKLNDENYKDVLGKADLGKIPKDAIIKVFVEISKTGTYDISKFKQMSEMDLEKEIKIIIDANPGMPFNALIGKVMGKLRGKADGKKIVELTKKLSEV